MKHRKAVLISLIAIITLIAGSALSASPDFSGPADEPVGRDVARLGILKSLEGTMRYMNKEWFLECEETTYELHMGPIGHEGELPFREGTTASVSGFVYGEHIAPIVVANQGTESRFWNENRTPSWAGQGDRRNAVTDPESGANAPEPRSGLAERGYRNAPPGAGRNRN